MRGLRALALLGLAVGVGGCLLGGPSQTPISSSGAPAASAPPSAPPASTVASAIPVASGGVLAPGTYARVSVDGLKIRTAAKTTATAIGALFFSDVVLVRSDAGESGGYHWYEVETVQTFNDTHLVGFIAGAKGGESYLEAMPGPPSPSPTRSASPSAAPSASPSPSG
jgi:hypothetical protein